MTTQYTENSNEHFEAIINATFYIRQAIQQAEIAEVTADTTEKRKKAIAVGSCLKAALTIALKP